MRRAPGLFVITALLVGCAPRDAAPPQSAASNRAEQVPTGLRPGLLIKGTPAVHFTIAERMAKYHVPGVSIAIVDSGRIVWARGFGVKEAGTTDSVTPETMFQAASISKPVGATAMLRLVQDGKLALDTPVNEYLKSWKLPDNRLTAKEPVTLRRIASHSAGLTVHGFPGYKTGDPVPTVPELLDGKKPANTAAVRVDTLPGAIMRYSGGGTTVMQLVVSDVTGEPYAAVAKRLVLDPIGMTNSTYEQPLPQSLRGREAAAHESDGTMTPGRWHTYPEQNAAGLWTTPTDLLKWAIEIAAARAGTSSKVLSQDIATQMLTVQKAPVGLGPFLEGSGRAFHFGHGGANQGFRCEVIYFPETGQGAAVMTNGEQGGALGKEIFLAIAEQYGWPEYGPREITLVPVDSTTVATYLGKFAIGAPFPATISITREAGRVFAEATPFMPKEELGFLEPGKAIALESGNELTFVAGGSGTVDTVRIGPFKFTRQGR